jgi:hypothetical protein
MRQEKLFKFPDLKDLPDNFNLGLINTPFTPGCWFLDDSTQENYCKIYLVKRDKDGNSTNKYTIIHCEMITDDPEVIKEWRDERDDYYDRKVRCRGYKYV